MKLALGTNVSHDVCPAVLLPHLDGEASQSSFPHAIVYEFSPALGCRSFGGERGDDFVPFRDDKGVGDVTSSLDLGERSYGFLTAVDFGEPSRRSRKEWETAHEKDARNELNTPSSSERSRAGNEMASVTDEVHDKNTPFLSQC